MDALLQKLNRYDECKTVNELWVGERYLVKETELKRTNLHLEAVAHTDVFLVILPDRYVG
jgi:hypothetical protein